MRQTEMTAATMARAQKGADAMTHSPALRLRSDSTFATMPASSRDAAAMAATRNAASASRTTHGSGASSSHAAWMPVSGYRMSAIVAVRKPFSDASSALRSSMSRRMP